MYVCMHEICLFLHFPVVRGREGERQRDELAVIFVMFLFCIIHSHCGFHVYVCGKRAADIHAMWRRVFEKKWRQHHHSHPVATATIITNSNSNANNNNDKYFNAKADVNESRCTCIWNLREKKINIEYLVRLCSQCRLSLPLSISLSHGISWHYGSCLYVNSLTLTQCESKHPMGMHSLNEMTRSQLNHPLYPNECE